MQILRPARGAPGLEKETSGGSIVAGRYATTLSIHGISFTRRGLPARGKICILQKGRARILSSASWNTCGQTLSERGGHRSMNQAGPTVEDERLSPSGPSPYLVTQAAVLWTIV
ncbi:hypothetical protein KM043_016349 [Ampulex compressa]|nr:hypothetical protein KM043_016349 [Ampulex compressa]